MSYSVKYFGKPLDESKYIIEKSNKVFISNEANLELDFSGECNWTFILWNSCNITARNSCIFNAGCNCKFHVGSDCIFRTREECSISAGDRCTIRTLKNCSFNLGSDCHITLNSGFSSITSRGNLSLYRITREENVFVKEPITLYNRNNLIRYTEDLLTKEQYDMMKELRT